MGTRETTNPGQVGDFLWVLNRSCPDLVQPLKDHWLTKVPHQKMKEENKEKKLKEKERRKEKDTEGRGGKGVG